MRYGTLCNDFTGIARLASGSDEAKALAVKHMRALEADLKQLRITNSAKNKRKKVSPTTVVAATVIDQSQGGSVCAPSSEPSLKIRDPTRTVAKGRPNEKRKKLGLGLKPTRPVKCSVCDSVEHNSARCLGKLTAMEFDLFPSRH